MPGSRITVSDITHVLLFACCVGGVYWLAFRWMLERMRRKPPCSRFDSAFRSKTCGVILLSLAAMGIACFAYGLLIEPKRLVVTEYTIESDKIPSGEHLRLVHLGDLHVRENGPREKALPELVSFLKPDIILHSGDFLAAAEAEPIVESLLKSWQVPQYACAGNMDYFGELEAVLVRAGVSVPSGLKPASLTVRGIRVTVSGFFSGMNADMHKQLQSLPSDTFNIVLYHHPEGFTETWNTPADLMLAGHTHGGQVRLPFYGALVTLDRFGKRFESGSFKEHGVNLVVSRGIGSEPNAPEFRFLCPPEVVVINVVGTGSNNAHKPRK